MRRTFNVVMRGVSTLIGVAMVIFGGIWILQGLGIAFQVGFMAGDITWALYGALTAIVGAAQVVWTNTRQDLPVISS